MTTARVTVRPDDGVEAAMRALVEHDVEAAPVVDANGAVVGLLSNSDLIVRESRLHFPTLLSFLGASIVLFLVHVPFLDRAERKRKAVLTGGKQPEWRGPA